MFYAALLTETQFPPGRSPASPLFFIRDKVSSDHLRCPRGAGTTGDSPRYLSRYCYTEKKHNETMRQLQQALLV